MLSIRLVEGDLAIVLAKLTSLEENIAQIKSASDTYTRIVHQHPDILQNVGKKLGEFGIGSGEIRTGVIHIEQLLKELKVNDESKGRA